MLSHPFCGSSPSNPQECEAGTCVHHTTAEQDMLASGHMIVCVAGVPGNLIPSVGRSTEGHQLAWHNPVEITILYLRSRQAVLACCLPTHGPRQAPAHSAHTLPGSMCCCRCSSPGTPHRVPFGCPVHHEQELPDAHTDSSAVSESCIACTGRCRAVAVRHGCCSATWRSAKRRAEPVPSRLAQPRAATQHYS